MWAVWLNFIEWTCLLASTAQFALVVTSIVASPAFAESKVVPYPKLPKCPARLAIKPPPANPIARYAFGHDHNSNDYKVLRIVNYKGASERNQQSRNLFHVYSPSTGSWRQIMNTPIDHSNIIIPDFLKKFAY